MPGDFAGIGTFLVAAFANTQFVVQALSLAALVTLGVLVTDIVRSFAAMPRVSRV